VALREEARTLGAEVDQIIHEERRDE
jgi:hypothetical protein